MLDKLVTHFGITRFTKDGGYILPEEMHGACDEITIVNLMAVTGVICYEARGRVHVGAEPTQLQRRKLFEV